ncbi:hypothetical protein EV356DRAFT_530001 [Viridothelium virens]|uniref:Integral membrane protein n=1 Tax=Viridothelium virens TaxID=1048519 RepID=A0A6A6HIM9_VIRVR|nr:hypothetical protein EV356DRAFT_530001 [Viridothelium virens]
MAPPSARSAPMNLLSRALVILAILPVVSTQQLLQYGTNQLPSCAQGCTLLNQAQSACVPPAAPVTNQAQYQSCFCQSAYLRTLYQSPNGVCDANCGQSDLVKIQQWYTGLCNSGAAATIPPGTSSTSAPPASSTSAVATASATTTIAPPDQNTNKSWISTHYQWVIFLIVLILAIAFFSIGGVWLKRRMKRRRAARRVGTFNSTVTTATMPGSSSGMRAVDWAPGIGPKPANPSSSRVGTPLQMSGGGAGNGAPHQEEAMRSVESGVGSTGSGSGSGKGKAQARVEGAEV